MYIKQHDNAYKRPILNKSMNSSYFNLEWEFNMEKEFIEKTLESFRKKKALVIGDYYLDEYISGKSDMFSAEAPVPRMVIKNKEYNPGAAGNVAVGFANLGAKTYACGVMGNDEQGKILLINLLEKQIITRGLIQDKNRLTGTFSRIMLDGNENIKQHVIQFDQENKHPVSPTSFENIKEYIEGLATDLDLIFFADYNENNPNLGLVNEDLINYCLNLAKTNGIKLVGISRKRIHYFNNFDIIILNKKEAEHTLSKTINTQNEVLEAGKVLQNKLNVRTLIITQGKSGATIFHNDGFISMPSLAKNVVSVCGAGDAFSVALSLAMSSNLSPRDSLEIAMISASICLTKTGTGTVEAREIQRYSKNNGTKNKIKDLDELLEIITLERKERKRISFTNGCFDLITAGQIDFLQKAKENGEILIVGINSDRSVTENKGPNRPILNQNERLKILASLECVDYVTVFEELTPINIISKIKPNILIKGGNYTKEGVIGKDIVESYNGEVVIIPINGKTTEVIIKTFLDR